MAVRWKDKGKLVALAGTERIPATSMDGGDKDGGGSVLAGDDIYISLADLKAYVLVGVGVGDGLGAPWFMCFRPYDNEPPPALPPATPAAPQPPAAHRRPSADPPSATPDRKKSCSCRTAFPVAIDTIQKRLKAAANLWQIVDTGRFGHPDGNIVRQHHNVHPIQKNLRHDRATTTRNGREHWPQLLALRLGQWNKSPLHAAPPSAIRFAVSICSAW